MGINTPHPWSFSPLRGEGVRGGSQEQFHGFGCTSCGFQVIKVIFQGFSRMMTMPVVPDADARWRASVPTARRGRKHARARVLPGQALTADCLARFFWGEHGCFNVKKVLLLGFTKVSGSRFQVSGFHKALQVAGMLDRVGGWLSWGGFSLRLGPLKVIFHGFQAFSGRMWKEGAMGINTPHPWSFSPLRGEGVRGGSQEQFHGFGCTSCGFQMIKVLFQGFSCFLAGGRAGTGRGGSWQRRCRNLQPGAVVFLGV